jgi:hypothetical protein
MKATYYGTLAACQALRGALMAAQLMIDAGADMREALTRQGITASGTRRKAILRLGEAERHGPADGFAEPVHTLI